MTDVKRDITLELGELELTFHLTPQDVTKYFNATTQANKVAPAHCSRSTRRTSTSS